MECSNLSVVYREGGETGELRGRNGFPLFSPDSFGCSPLGSFANVEAVLVSSGLQGPGDIHGKCPTIYVRAVQNEEFSHQMC